MAVRSLHHVQLAMPPGREDEARAFYQRILGLREVPKPANLATRGGCWFEQGPIKLHLGVEVDFRPARKAHPAFVVDDLPALETELRASGHQVVGDEDFNGFRRVHADDPFGNRIELMESTGTPRS